QCLDAARRFYAGRAFVRVTDKPPQTKWATGSNLAFVSYAADPERNLVIAMGVVDNLGKGAAGQAVQNANLICGLPENAGLDGVPVWRGTNGTPSKTVTPGLSRGSTVPFAEGKRGWPGQARP